MENKTIMIINTELQIKVNRAIKLIQAAADAIDGPIELCYSGGKDSDVILQLAKEAGVNYRSIYKNTTIDPPGTIKHAKEMGAEIVKPKITFFQLIEKKMYPTRFARFCCEHLKEYKILDKQIIGVRSCESVMRKKRYQEPTACRIFRNKEKVEQIYPILDWSNDDCLAFILNRGIKLHPLYYRQNGTIDMTRRLGCIGCPMASKKKRLEGFCKYPNMVKAYIHAGQKFMDTHPEGNITKMFDGNIYDKFVASIFCDNLVEYQELKHTLFGVTDCKAYIEEYFGIKL